MVSTSPDKGDRAVSSDIALQRFAATLIGLVLGQFAGDKSVIVAKAFLYLWSGPSYEQWHVTQASLVVIFLVIGAGAAFGVFMERRGWTNYEQIVLSVFVAVFAALFVIVDQALPKPVFGPQLPFKETIYYLGWLMGLWLVPVILLPNPDPGFARKIRRGSGLIVVSIMIAIVCWFVGMVLIAIAKFAHEHSSLSEIMQGEAANFTDSRKFWLASPSTVNPICGLFFVIAFSPIWWQELWQHTKRVKAWLWIGSFVAYTIVYTGVFGGVFYATRGWACSLVARDLASAWQFFLAFGALPVVVTVTVLLAFWLTRREKTPNAVGWWVSDRFWWFLSPGLAIGFALVALFGFGPLALSDGASWPQIVVLATAHAVNGALLGLLFRISEPAMKLVRVVTDDSSVGGRPTSPP